MLVIIKQMVSIRQWFQLGKVIGEVIRPKLRNIYQADTDRFQTLDLTNEHHNIAQSISRT